MLIVDSTRLRFLGSSSSAASELCLIAFGLEWADIITGSVNGFACPYTVVVSLSRWFVLGSVPGDH